MSILIKDMKMPKDIEPGLVIEFANSIDGTRYARLYHYRHGGLTEWLEVIPVPEHGKLIDADALEQDAQKRLLMCNNNDNQFQKPYEVMRAIALAPTIIPASKEGEA